MGHRINNVVLQEKDKKVRKKKQRLHCNLKRCLLQLKMSQRLQR